ncbi:copper homeostasis protein CutC [Mycoplasmopsis lipofaciens]|uniref:copper homeostasis protein CutC n=1 Tax=Mycoplasmopsis lipofaciens TaxID=114884 RepID=UPI000482C7D6|nr:copper homeostasis protein CutC [Mycoplasmopsis lipofaciens]
MSKDIQFEICVDSYESALNVTKTSAKRIELCSNLDAGGLTPSVGLTKLVKMNTNLEVFALIRPRVGNFIYNQSEKDVILEEIKSLININVDGLVVGALTNDFEIDIEFLKEIKKIANNTPLVFHRAFDQVQDPFKATKELINLGFIRVLTSGQAKNAYEGRKLIFDLNQKFGDKIIFMAGAGINKNTAKAIVEETKCNEIHFSAKSIYKNNAKISNKVSYNTATLKENEIPISKTKDIQEIIDLFK